MGFSLNKWQQKPERLFWNMFHCVCFQRVTKIFKQECDFRYKTSTFGEWRDAPQNSRDFFNRSRSKNRQYLITIQKGNSSESDCSCLLFTILFSDIIGTTLSAAIKKGVDDIRQVRNDIAHTISYNALYSVQR